MYITQITKSKQNYDCSVSSVKRKKPRRPLSSGLILIAKLFLGFDNFFPVIVTTFRAHTVRHLHFVALRALNQARSSQLPVRTAGIAACFGHFSLRYCHFPYTS